MPLLGPDLERFKDSLSALNRRVSHSDMQAFARQLTEALGCMFPDCYLYPSYQLTDFHYSPARLELCALRYQISQCCTCTEWELD